MSLSDLTSLALKMLLPIALLVWLADTPAVSSRSNLSGYGFVVDGCCDILSVGR